MKHFLQAVVLIFVTSTCFAQDIHFSQYYSAPLTINPAQTGLFDGNYRLGLNYRDQWASVTVPYQTFSAFADGNLWKQPYNMQYLGIGLLVTRDQAGDGELADTKIFGSLAYHVLLNKKRTMQLSFGLQGGIVDETVDFSKLYFDDQWNDVAFNQSIPSGENYVTGSTNYVDINLGTMFSYNLPDVWSCYFGGALYNVVRPRLSFYNYDNDLGLRPIMQGGVSFKVGQYYSLSPSAIAMFQKGANEALAGVMGSYSPDLSSQSGQKVYLGAYMRTGDAAIIAAGYEVSRIRFIASYDINFSALEPASHGNGAFELSLIYIGLVTKESEHILVPCPRF